MNAIAQHNAECVRTRTLRILCDVDGVLADFVGLVLDYVQRNTGLHYRREAVDTWNALHLDCLGLLDHEGAFTAWCDSGAGESMHALPGARDFWVALLNLADVKACTAPFTDNWYGQRSRWVREHFNITRDRLIFTAAKHELAGAWDVLIDDNVENCEAFARAGGVAWCIAAPYNTHLRERFDVRRGSHSECLVWLRSL